jgi:bacterioferritin
MIREDLVAERIAIESYREMIDYLRDKDHTTRRLVEEILAVEEEHAGDLTGLLAGLGKRSSHGADHYASDVKTPDSNGRTA